MSAFTIVSQRPHDDFRQEAALTSDAKVNSPIAVAYAGVTAAARGQVTAAHGGRWRAGRDSNYLFIWSVPRPDRVRLREQSKLA